MPAAPDRNTVTYEIARTWAAGKQWPEAIEWLDKVGALKSGLDPSRDSIFIELRGSCESAAIMEAVRDATPPVLHSTPAFRVREGDLIPESLAYDPKTKQFYLGSTKKGKIFRCTAQGACATFADGLGEVLGLKIDARGLWLLNSSPNESALIRYDFSSDGLHKYVAPASCHELNDLTIAPFGDVYLTDTPSGSVWHLAHGAADFEMLPPKSPSPTVSRSLPMLACSTSRLTPMPSML